MMTPNEIIMKELSWLLAFSASALLTAWPGNQFKAKEA